MAVIILLNIELLFNSIEMLLLFLVLLFSDFKQAVVQINISFVDYSISTLLIFMIPLLF